MMKEDNHQTIDANNNEPKESDSTLKPEALEFVDRVKEHYADNPAVFADFLDAMNGYSTHKSETTLVKRIMEIFKGNNEIIQAFNVFLPPKYRINIEDIYPPVTSPIREFFDLAPSESTTTVFDDSLAKDSPMTFEEKIKRLLIQIKKRVNELELEEENKGKISPRGRGRGRGRGRARTTRLSRGGKSVSGKYFEKYKNLVRVLMHIQSGKMQFNDGMSLISGIISSIDFPDGKLVSEWNNILEPILDPEVLSSTQNSSNHSDDIKGDTTIISPSGDDANNEEEFINENETSASNTDAQMEENNDESDVEADIETEDSQPKQNDSTTDRFFEFFIKLKRFTQNNSSNDPNVQWSYDHFMKFLHLYNENVITMEQMMMMMKENIFSQYQDPNTQMLIPQSFPSELFEEFQLLCKNISKKSNDADDENKLKNQSIINNMNNSVLPTLELKLPKYLIDKIPRPRTYLSPAQKVRKIDINLQSCIRDGVSYRELPLSYIQSTKCSGRTDLCYEVLNDQWVSIPTFSDDISNSNKRTSVNSSESKLLSSDINSPDSYPSSSSYMFKSSIKNQYEENLFKCEDDRFEIDMVLESNNSTILLLTSLYQCVIMPALSSDNLESLSNFSIQQYLDVIHKRAIQRIYGTTNNPERDILSLLSSNPVVAIPVVIQRMQQKDKDWKKIQNELKMFSWKEAHEKNHYRALDREPLYFKKKEKKKLNTRDLVVEIKKQKFNQQKTLTYNAPKLPPKTPYHLKFKLEDRGLIYDIIELIKLQLQKNAQNLDIPDETCTQIKSFFNSFIKYFFSLPTSQPPNLPPFDEEDLNVKRKKVFYGGTSFYFLFRHIQTLYSSLYYATTMSKIIIFELRNYDLAMRGTLPLIFSKLHQQYHHSCMNPNSSLADLPSPFLKFPSMKSIFNPLSSPPQSVDNTTSMNLESAQLNTTPNNTNNTTPVATFNTFNNHQNGSNGLNIAAEQPTSILSPTLAPATSNSSSSSSSSSIDNEWNCEDIAMEILETYYYFLYNLVYPLISGEIDQQKYEDDCRELFGASCFALFTVDKVLKSIINQIHEILLDGASEKLIALFMTSQINDQYLQAYRKMGFQEQLDNRLYEFSYITHPKKNKLCNSRNGILGIKMIDSYELYPQVVNKSEDWKDYVERYFNNSRFEVSSDNSTREDRYAKKNLLYLVRAKNRVKNAGREDKFSVFDSLQATVCMNSFRLIYVGHTFDYLQRVKDAKRKQRKFIPKKIEFTRK